LLGVFTMSMAYLVGIVTALFAQSGQGELIVEAVFITATVFIGLTLFTLQSKWDFSFLGAGLGVCLWIMVLWGFFGAIFGLAQGSVYALLGSVLFSAYIIFDTYMIAERLDPEDYIVAAIELYLDLVNLFLMILRLLSENSNRH
jgi:protein lifeguard